MVIMHATATLANTNTINVNNNNGQFSSSNVSNGKQIKIGNYVLGTTIGKGNSAVVKMATHVITQEKACDFLYSFQKRY
jgi:hypothetical protein